MSDVRPGVAACLMIPPVQGFAMGDWDATERAMTGGARLDFYQAWLPQPEAEFAPAHVWLGIHGGELLVYVVLQDDQPANRATQWNEPTWRTGDVVEFFFQAEGSTGYYEFHVTPENQRLQLYFPERELFRRHALRYAIAESCFESVARINDARDGWQVVMRVDLARVFEGAGTAGGTPGDAGGGNEVRRAGRFRYSLSRYDYQPGREQPVTSATTALSRPDFHHIEEWSWARVDAADASGRTEAGVEPLAT